MTEQSTTTDETNGAKKKSARASSMEIVRYHLLVTFTESVLGTQPQKDVATEFITSKAADPATGELPEDELETLPVALEKGTTAFHKLPDGTPIYYDYMLKGFLKEAGLTFNGLEGVKNLRSKLDNYVFPAPRRITLHLPATMTDSESGEDIPAKMTYCERPLRAQTAQGPRTSLARSEELPAGTWFECDLEVYSGSEITFKLLEELLTYGARKGLGQWRNGGHGRFEYVLTE